MITQEYEILNPNAGLQQVREPKPFIYVNGVQTTRDYAIVTAQKIADTVGSPVALVWNDFYQQNGYNPVEMSSRLFRVIVEQSTANQITIIAHSHGSVVLSEALRLIERRITEPNGDIFAQIKNRCRVVTCGAVALIKSDRVGGGVRNYIDERDAVSLLGTVVVNVKPTQASPVDNVFIKTMKIFFAGLQPNAHRVLGLEASDEQAVEALKIASEKFDSCKTVSRFLTSIQPHLRTIINRLNEDYLGDQRVTDQVVLEGTAELASFFVSFAIKMCPASKPEGEYQICILEASGNAGGSQSSSSSSARSASLFDAHSISNYLNNEQLCNYLRYPFTGVGGAGQGPV